MNEQEQRNNIKILFDTEITNCMELSRRTGVSKCTVYHTVYKLRNAESVDRKVGSGKQRQIKANSARSLFILAINNPRLSVRKLTCKFNKRRGLSFSHEAVRIEMKRRGFTRKVARKIPMLTQTHKANRVDWAKSNRCRDWEKVIFSDEMSIWLAGGRVCAWCKAFSARGMFPIKVSRENLTGRLYCDILHECLVEQASVLYPDGWVFQEDNDPKHTCKLAKGYMEEKGMHRMDWSACSPELNPIENLWSWIKREIDLKSPRNLNELDRELNEVWNSLEHEFYVHFGHRYQKESN
ncbi:hypothetical protein LOD99_15148 [Oopsacas minuta]|uniref:Tc1-like transposase DDE domain-containing protein n=1 Tax=Oopsacas minuta TaxID=111878 RepID=A0AAV7KD73_9METZ|nr:hypothetical protein LOD99_15148 [Oopsacas minuta]